MINVTLDHNDPKRLYDEFVNPLREWADEHMAVMVYVEDDESLLKREIAYVALFPSHERFHDGTDEEIAWVSFLPDGTSEGSNDTLFSSWSLGARELIAVILEESREEIKRAKKLESGLVELVEILKKKRKTKS